MLLYSYSIDGSPFSQFIQLIWADTYTVGCAAAEYKNGMLWIVCDYGPSFYNVNGESPDIIYKRGPVASACPAGTTKEIATGLCA